MEKHQTKITAYILEEKYDLAFFGTASLFDPQK